MPCVPVFYGLVVKNPAYADLVEGGAKDRWVQMRVPEQHLAAAGP